MTGARKGIERVGLGAWFQVVDNDEQMWVCVHAKVRGVHPATGRKVTELRGATETGQLVSFIDHDNELVLALTKAEAKKAGFVDPHVAAGDLS